jgi:hypothetical protein
VSFHHLTIELGEHPKVTVAEWQLLPGYAMDSESGGWWFG